MAEPYAEVNQYMLASAFKKAARQYLYSAQQYDREDCAEFVMEVWEELTDYHEDNQDVPKMELGGFDEYNDPAGILRAFDSLIEEFRRAQIMDPELQKIMHAITSIPEKDIDLAEWNDVDLMGNTARSVLAATGEPVPGRLRIMLTNWGLLSPK